MKILIFKINNFLFGIELDKILKIEKRLPQNEKFRYIDLYKKFFDIKKELNNDYFVFLKNGIVFNTESVINITDDIPTLKFEFNKCFLKGYNGLVKEFFIIKNNIGLILNENKL